MKAAIRFTCDSCHLPVNPGDEFTRYAEPGEWEPRKHKHVKCPNIDTLFSDEDLAFLKTAGVRVK